MAMSLAIGSNGRRSNGVGRQPEKEVGSPTDTGRRMQNKLPRAIEEIPAQSRKKRSTQKKQAPFRSRKGACSLTET